MIDLDQALQPGKKVRVWYAEKHPGNRLLHIRAIVDDDWVVFKEWWYSKKRWHYDIEHRYFFELRNQSGNIMKVR